MTTRKSPSPIEKAAAILLLWFTYSTVGTLLVTMNAYAAITTFDLFWAGNYLQERPYAVLVRILAITTDFFLCFAFWESITKAFSRVASWVKWAATTPVDGGRDDGFRD